MLFFKEIREQKLADPDFKAFYEKECHLCALTVKVISLVEEREEDLDTILTTLQIAPQDYAALKSGDHCLPEQVFKLCHYLGMEEADPLRNCPRRKI